MSRFGSDKPDLRFGMEIGDLTDIAAETGFQVMRSAAESGGSVKGLVAPGCAGYPRRQIDELTAFARERGAAGLVTIALDGDPDSSLEDLTEEDVRSPAARFLSLTRCAGLPLAGCEARRPPVDSGRAYGGNRACSGASPPRDGPTLGAGRPRSAGFRFRG